MRPGGNATSTQALREWNRIVFGAIVALRKALPSAQDRQDLVKMVLHGVFGQSAAARWQVTEWIVGAETDFRVVEMRLKTYQRIRARLQFNADISTVRDGTECGVAQRVPSIKRNGSWHYADQCRKDEEICTQPDFFGKQRTRALAAAAALEASGRKKDRQMGKKAREALESSDPLATKGKACHAANGLGGDICIALECGTDETLLTTDASFDVICPAIGVQHKRL